MIRKLLLLLTVATGTISSFAQNSTNDRVTEYIKNYKDMAIFEQQRSGVPASITLAQGLLETSGGQSELCSNASNHFGIKCKSTWTGETYAYTDDAKNECFRKYKSAKESYTDHSDFLKNNKRYSSLFSISPTDYAAWAYGLKKCGYATNNQYAQKLIKYIENYQLQQFTYAALNNNGDDILFAATQNKNNNARSKSVSTVIPGENIPVSDVAYKAARISAPEYATTDEIYVEKATPQDEKYQSKASDYYVVTYKNGIKGFYAKKGDVLLEQAIKNKIRYAKLLEFNDLPDGPLAADMFIYLTRKPKTATAYTHTVRAGETMQQISQEEGVQLEQLLAFNHLKAGQEPVTGSEINLQSASNKTPDTYVSASTTSTFNNQKPQLSNDAGFVPGGKTVTQQAKDVTTNNKSYSTKETKTEVVNIANESAVEDEIRVTKPAKSSTKSTPVKENLSALDKLKAHMDEVVYNKEEFVPKSTKDYEANDNNNEEIETTTPAKKAKIVTTKKIEPKAAKAKIHTVRKGDTLFSIADKYGMTVKELQQLNKIKGNNIQPGAKLKVAK